MHKNSGFTFIEMMAVIGIIAVVAAIVLPNVVAWLPRYRLNSGAEEIQSTLQLARLGAIKENANATVTFDTANHSFLAAIEGRTIRNGKMPAGIRIDSVTNPASQVTFDGRGLANGSTGNILVKNTEGGEKIISVNIVGTTSIQ